MTCHEALDKASTLLQQQQAVIDALAKDLAKLRAQKAELYELRKLMQETLLHVQRLEVEMQLLRVTPPVPTTILPSWAVTASSR